MAFQPVPDGGQAVVRGTFGDATAYVNVFGVNFTDIGTLTQGDADDIADLLSTAYNIIDGYWPTDFQLNDVVVTDLRTEGAAEFVSTSGFPIVGDNGGQALPYQTAAVVSWATSTRGRSYRGRTYLGGFAEQYSNGKVIDSALLADLDDFATAIVTGDPNRFTVISRYHDGTKRDEATWLPITAGVPNPHWRSQRRRQYT